MSVVGGEGGVWGMRVGWCCCWCIRFNRITFTAFERARGLLFLKRSASASKIQRNGKFNSSEHDHSDSLNGLFFTCITLAVLQQISIESNNNNT